MVQLQLNSFQAQYFLQSVSNAPSPGSLFRIGAIWVIKTCVITWKFWWKLSIFFRPIQLFWCPSGWVAVLLRLFFCCWCWKCCAAAIDKKFLSLRRLELRTLWVWGPRDYHYTMVTLWKLSRLISVRWLCNMFVVDVKAVGSNGLLAQLRSLLSTLALITK